MYTDYKFDFFQNENVSKNNEQNIKNISLRNSRNTKKEEKISTKIWSCKEKIINEHIFLKDFKMQITNSYINEYFIMKR